MATNISGAGTVSGAGTSGLLASSAPPGALLGITKVIEDPVTGRPVLGGGLEGYIPPVLVDTDNTYEDYESLRFTVREAWNTDYRGQLARAHRKRVITPFRAVNNAGDVLSRQYTFYSCGGSPQTFQSRPGLRGLARHFGAIHSNCDGTGVPAAACNVRYVYDSSDYTTYLKQKAVNKTYNNISNGGNMFNGAYVAIRGIRRY